VATIGGVPIYVGLSWLWIAALYLYAGYLRFNAYPWQLDPASSLAYAALSFVLFFGAVLLHEGAHAVVARSFGLPVSGITLVFWGGATETRSNARGPLVEFLVAAAGPGTTLVVAGVFWLAARPMDPSVAREIVSDLAFLNILFAGLNAVPGFPLDGGRMLLAATWGATHDRRTALRVAGWGGLTVGSLFFALAIYTGLQQNIGLGIFFGYLGAILVGTGRTMSERIALRDVLHRGLVAEAMRPPPQSVPATMSLSGALDHVLREHPSQSFPVVAGGRVLGTISMASARRLGSKDPLKPARDAVIPLSQAPALAPGDSLDDALEWLGGKDAMVLDDGVLVGALGPADVERWYRARFEQGAGAVPTTPADLPSTSGAPTEIDASIPPRPDADQGVGGDR
jgi:Zn-dependent protease